MADDDAGSRRAVADAFELAGHSTTEARDGRQALAAAARTRPALVIAEVLLPLVCGYEVCHAVKVRYGPTVPVVLMSERRTAPADRVAGLLIGADDYVTKPVLPGELLVRVDRLLGGSRVGALAGVERLTPREQHVMALLSAGLTEVEIAERLVVTRRTVAKHVEHILGKLGVHSRTQAVALALRARPVAHLPAL